MRALWKGAVTFGLVNVPVRLYAAPEDHDVRFHQVHAEDGGRIRLKRECEVCGRQLSYSEIAKGYEDSSGRRLIMDPEELTDLAVPGGRDIDVMEFVPAEQVDPTLFDRTYYLEPDARATKPYVLLREALASTERVAIVKVAIRQRTQLACLRVRDGGSVLQTLKWADEVRAADFGFRDEEPPIRPQELRMAESLVESMAGDFDPAEYHDDYREALLALIDAKLAGGEGMVPEVVEGRDEPAPVVDLMAALRESVARSQAARGKSSDGAAAAVQRSASTRTAGTPTAKQSTAKKSAPKKPAGKKSTAKKPAAKKPAAKKSTARKPAPDTGTQTTARTTARTAARTATKRTATRKRSA